MRLFPESEMSRPTVAAWTTGATPTGIWPWRRRAMTVDGAVSKRYFWNAADQLTAYTSYSTAVSAAYAYDSSGRRVRKVVWSGGVSDVTRFVWEGPRLLAELDGQGAPKRRYVYRGFTPLAMVEYGGGAPVPYFYVTDSLGTPWKLVDASGAVVWSASYKAFGEATVSGVVEQSLRFPGQYEDAESGLHYNYKRYYEPGAGRYLSVDPLRSGHEYAYAHANSLSYVDPTGEVIPLAVAGAIIGGGIDLMVQLIDNGGKLADVNLLSVGASAIAGASGVGLANAVSVLGKKFAWNAAQRVFLNAIGSALIGGGTSAGLDLAAGCEVNWLKAGFSSLLSGILGGAGSAFEEALSAFGKFADTILEEHALKTLGMNRAAAVNYAKPVLESGTKSVNTLGQTLQGAGTAGGVAISNSGAGVAYLTGFAEKLKSAFGLGE